MKKKLIATPALLLLVLSVAACGNKDSASTGSEAVIRAAVVAPATSSDLLSTNPNDFLYWCQQRGGTYYASQSVCRIQETTQFQWNQNYGSIDTGIPVFVNDTVSIISSGNPAVNIGGASYTASSTFESHTQGNLVLQGDGFSKFKLKSIQLTRCYQSGYAVRCP